MGELTTSRVMAVVLMLTAILAIVGELQGPVRAAATLPFLLVGPGLTWTDRLPKLGIGERLCMALAITLALEAFVTACLLLTARWTTLATFWILVSATAAGMLASAPDEEAAGQTGPETDAT